jgi:2-haloacid dehalogenase
MSEIEALVFDVFGTVVDWRTSLIDNFTAWANKGDQGRLDGAGGWMACGVHALDG